MNQIKLMVAGILLGMVVTSVMASGYLNEAGDAKASYVTFSSAN
jgi:hypothetical protein